LKTGIYSVLCAFITNAAIGACFVPFLLLGFKKVRQIATFWILGIYWLLNGLVDLRTFPSIHSVALHQFLLRLSEYYDLVDAPLVLLIFAVAGAGKWRRQLLLVLLGLIAGETFLISGKGYAFAWPVVIGIGVLLILVYSITGLWKYLKKMEHDQFENAMAYVYGSFLFAYGTYLIIYLFYYYLRATKTTYSQTDSYLLYYTSLLLSAGITSAGVFTYGWRRTKNPNLRYSSSSS
jgi:hypothetical protein